MARPPKLIGKIPKVTADWQWIGEWPITTNAIMAGTWQLQNENKAVFLFANVSDNSLAVHLEFDAREYGFPGKLLEVTIITPIGLQDRFTFHTADRLELKLAARSVLAWEMTPVSGN